VHNAADAARIEIAFRKDRTNACDDTLLRVGMRRQDLTSPAAASIVIVDYEIGKRAADIDTERIFAHLPIQVLRCISSSSRSTAGFDRQPDADLPVLEHVAIVRVSSGP
jgi:hypothetical protein